jgi:hypothetical protein
VLLPLASYNSEPILIKYRAAAACSSAASSLPILTAGSRPAQLPHRAAAAVAAATAAALGAAGCSQRVCAHSADGHGQCCALLLLSHALRPVAVLSHQLLPPLRHQRLLLQRSLQSNVSYATSYSCWWRTVQTVVSLCPYIITGSNAFWVLRHQLLLQ